MRTSSPFGSMFSLGGWIFADLMLVLALLFFSANHIASQEQTPTPSDMLLAASTSTQTPTITPYPDQPTYTPAPTYPILPIYTLAPTYPILPTYTPAPTYTAVPALSTYTPFPPLPTYTAIPPWPTYTPVPTLYPTLPVKRLIPTYTPTPSPTSSQQCVTLLSPNWIALENIPVNYEGVIAGDAASIANFENAFQLALAVKLNQSGLDWDTIQVGMVLTYGSVIQSRERSGTAYAGAVNNVIIDLEPFTNAVTRNFLDLQGAASTVSVDVYLFTTSCG